MRKKSRFGHTASPSYISHFYLELHTAVLCRDSPGFHIVEVTIKKLKIREFCFFLPPDTQLRCTAPGCFVPGQSAACAPGTPALIKEQTGQGKLPREFNTGGGTKYSLLSIPCSEFVGHKRIYIPFQVPLFAFALNKHPALKILLTSSAPLQHLLP